MANKANIHCKYKEWLEPDNLTRIKGWARDGLTHEEIAEKMGVSFSSLRIWRRKYKDIEIALAKGRDVVDREVEETLFKKAIKGDTTAMIFWLKNRKPDEWRNFVERATKEDKEEQRARINRILLENEKLKAEIEKIRGETDRAQHDDGFLAALSAAAEEDWSNGDEDPS